MQKCFTKSITPANRVDGLTSFAAMSLRIAFVLCKDIAIYERDFLRSIILLRFKLIEQVYTALQALQALNNESRLV